MRAAHWRHTAWAADIREIGEVAPLNSARDGMGQRVFAGPKNLFATKTRATHQRITGWAADTYEVSFVQGADTRANDIGTHARKNVGLADHKTAQQQTVNWPMRARRTVTLQAQLLVFARQDSESAQPTTVRCRATALMLQ